MSTIACTTNRFTRSLLVTCLVVAVRAASAEVAVVTDPQPNQGSGGVVRFGIVIDDSTPVGNAWRRIIPSSAAIVLNEAGDERGDGMPSILGNPSGICAVAWAKNSPAGFDVVLSRFVDGGWTPEVVLAGNALDELDPFLLEGPGGAVHLFYWESGPTPRILMRVASPDLTSWSAAVAVSEPGVASARPSAVFHEGSLWIAYEVHDYGLEQAPRQVVAARWDGDEWVREIVAISSSSEPLRPEVHSRGGRMWVDWIDAPGQMLWVRRDTSGVWGAIQSIPYSTVLERDFFARGSVMHFATE